MRQERKNNQCQCGTPSFGFKLHLMVNDEGELLAFRVTSGEVDDKAPVRRMTRGLWGQLFGDRGYISRALHKALWSQGLVLITLIRHNMKPRLMRLWGRLMLRSTVSGLPVMM